MCDVVILARLRPTDNHSWEFWPASRAMFLHLPHPTCTALPVGQINQPEQEEGGDFCNQSGAAAFR